MYAQIEFAANFRLVHICYVCLCVRWLNKAEHSTTNKPHIIWF